MIIYSSLINVSDENIKTFSPSVREAKSQVSIKWKLSQVKVAIPLPFTMAAEQRFVPKLRWIKYNHRIPHYDITKKTKLNKLYVTVTSKKVERLMEH